MTGAALVFAVLGSFACSRDSAAEKAPRETGSSKPSAASQADETDRWWRLVEAVGIRGSQEPSDGRLREHLDMLEDGPFRGFVEFYVDRLAAAERGSLWRAARAAGGHCNRECFGRVRAELVFRGRADYERALAGDHAFAEDGGLPTVDAGAEVLAQWQSRFGVEPFPTPSVAAPADDPLGREIDAEPEAAARADGEHCEVEGCEGEMVGDALQPASRIVPPPRELAAFCLDTSPDVPRFTNVRINGRACSNGRPHSTESGPWATMPFPRARLCAVLSQDPEIAGYLEDEEAECALAVTLPDGYAVYTVGPRHTVSYFLVHLQEDTAQRVAYMRTFFSGNGNRSEYLRGQQLETDGDSVTFLWREAVADWDRGYDEYNASEVCMAIRCEREGAGRLCSVPRPLRSYGGSYGEGPMNEERNWPEVGEPTEQWDCRPGWR